MADIGLQSWHPFLNIPNMACLVLNIALWKATISWWEWAETTTHTCGKEIPSNHLHLSIWPSKTWSLSPRCPPDSELPLAPTITNTCLLASFFTSSSKPSLLLTTGNHGLWFLLWFHTKQLHEAEIEFCHVTPAFASPLLEFTLLPLKSFL